jgi:two-component system, LytTR family, sensor kinase
MKKSVLAVVYFFFFFMYFIGFSLMGHLNQGRLYDWSKLADPFTISTIIYTVLTVCLAHFVVFKRYYHTRPRYPLWLALTVLLFFNIFLRYAIEELLYPAVWGFRNYSADTSIRYYIVDNIYYGSIIIFIGFVFFLLDDQFYNQRQKAALLRQNREAELNFLRSQMNPHFLFNSLNNIYALSYSRNPAATDAILKLSNMMRYITYEKEALVPVTKELSYVTQLIELQQLRLDHSLKQQIECDAATGNALIPPFILVPLIENALKHGAFTHEPLRVSITPRHRHLHIQVANQKNKNEKDATGGVGLENIKKRLSLLYTEKEYTFTITETGDFFTVDLLLPQK